MFLIHPYTNCGAFLQQRQNKHLKNSTSSEYALYSLWSQLHVHTSVWDRRLTENGYSKTTSPSHLRVDSEPVLNT